MRLEALNNSQLLQESERLTGEIPHAQETAQTLGTDEGVERFRYSQSSGLELPFLIRRVGRIRHRIVSGIVPALERRRQQVQSLIENYPRRLAQAEGVLDTIREGLVTIYTPEELSLAEQALQQARVEFEPLEQITAEIIAPKPYRHLYIPVEGNRAILTVIYGDSEEQKSSRVVKLNPDESKVLMTLARAAELEHKRLRPKELAERAFKKTPSDVGLSQLVAGLRGKLNAEEIFVDSSGAARGPAVEYGIAEGVYIRSEQLQEEKEEAEKLSKRGKRLNKLRDLVIKRKGTKLAAFFEEFIKNFGEKVEFVSTQSIRNMAKIIRDKIGVEVIGGYRYELKTYRTRGRGLNYSFVEIAVSVPEKPQDEEPEGLEVSLPEKIVEIGGEQRTPPKEEPTRSVRPPRGDREVDLYAQIKRKDPGVIGRIERITARVIEIRRDFFIVPEIEALFSVPDHTIEQAIKEGRVRPDWFEGAHGRLSPGEVVWLIAQEGYRFNLTKREKKQLRRLIKIKVAEAIRKNEKNGNSMKK